MEPGLKILGLILGLCIFWYSQRKNILWSANISTIKQYSKGELSFPQTIGIILIGLYFWSWFPAAIFLLMLALLTAIDLRFPYLMEPASILWKFYFQILAIALTIGLIMKIYKAIFKK